VTGARSTRRRPAQGGSVRASRAAASATRATSPASGFDHNSTKISWRWATRRGDDSLVAEHDYVRAEVGYGRWAFLTQDEGDPSRSRQADRRGVDRGDGATRNPPRLYEGQVRSTITAGSRWALVTPRSPGSPQRQSCRANLAGRLRVDLAARVGSGPSAAYGQNLAEPVVHWLLTPADAVEERVRALAIEVRRGRRYRRNSPPSARGWRPPTSNQRRPQSGATRGVSE